MSMIMKMKLVPGKTFKMMRMVWTVEVVLRLVRVLRELSLVLGGVLCGTEGVQGDAQGATDGSGDVVGGVEGIRVVLTPHDVKVRAVGLELLRE
ncbi:hypothetical protein Q9L58_010569, partial [Maublancomyces gigas]